MHEQSSTGIHNAKYTYCNMFMHHGFSKHATLTPFMYCQKPFHNTTKEVYTTNTHRQKPDQDHISNSLFCSLEIAGLIERN